MSAEATPTGAAEPARLGESATDPEPAWVDERAMDERRQAVRALLRRPLLCAEADPEGFTLVRRHREWIAERVEHLLGYRLSVRADHARLHKRARIAYPDRPARIRPASRRPGPEDGWRPFSRRHYVLLALTLSALESHPGRVQALIGGLASEVAALGAELGLRVDFERRDERKAFAEALELLGRHGVLRQRDGSAEAFVSRSEHSEEALFDIERTRLGDLKSTPVAIEESSTAAELIAPDPALTEEGERTRRRHQLARALVEEPVVYTDDLEPAVADTYRSQRHRLEPELEELSGLASERRAEGSALVDSDRKLTDLRFPTRSTESQLALLACERLRKLAYEGERNPLPASEVEGMVAKLRRQHRVEGGAELDRDVVSLLASHGLVRREEPSLVRVLPALARFSHPSVGAAA